MTLGDGRDCSEREMEGCREELGNSQVRVSSLERMEIRGMKLPLPDISCIKIRISIEAVFFLFFFLFSFLKFH